MCLIVRRRIYIRPDPSFAAKFLSDVDVVESSLDVPKFCAGTCQTFRRQWDTEHWSQFEVEKCLDGVGMSRPWRPAAEVRHFANHPERGFLGKHKSSALFESSRTQGTVTMCKWVRQDDICTQTLDLVVIAQKTPFCTTIRGTVYMDGIRSDASSNKIIMWRVYI